MSPLKLVIRGVVLLSILMVGRYTFSDSYFGGGEMSINDGLVYKRSLNANSYGRGYVGIGLSNPTQNFVVNGSVLVSGNVLNSEHSYADVGSGGTLTLDLSAGNLQCVTINGTVSLQITNRPNAAALYRITIGGLNNPSINFGQLIKFPESQIPILATSNCLYLFYDGATSENGSDTLYGIRELGPE
ncbi:hypothetical protein EB093_00685 [bacterium]|nr:hypothetical protein [bacterium]